METKICNTCHQEKTITRFRPHKRIKCGREAKCKDCFPQGYKEAQKAIRRTAHPRYRKSHYDANKEYYIGRSKAHYHKKRSNGGSFTDKEWKNLCESFSNRCACCGKEGKLTIDHIVPISLGGTNYIKNIQPLCQPCNSKKSTKTINYRT